MCCRKILQSKTVWALSDRGFMMVQEIIEFADTEEQKMLRIFLIFRSNVMLIFPRKAWLAIMELISVRILLKTYGTDDVKIRAKAKAAAGSDARMNGCEMPVVIQFRQW